MIKFQRIQEIPLQKKKNGRLYIGKNNERTIGKPLSEKNANSVLQRRCTHLQYIRFDGGTRVTKMYI